jgi:aspartyl/asparaginyl-tRNA synthetase
MFTIWLMQEDVRMPVIMIDAVGQHVGQEVTIRGWLRSRRDSGNFIS